METISDNRETSKPSFHRKSTKLTLIEDLVDEDPSSSWHNVEEDSYPSDCESAISGTEGERKLQLLPNNNGLIRIHEGEMIHETIKKKLISSLSSAGFNARVESIHRNDFSDIMKRAKLQSFCSYAKAMEIKSDGNANVKYAWYGASKTEINSILTNGFGLPMTNNGACGHGVYLSPVDHPIESLQSAVGDDNGLHMLLCRVIIGKTEVVSHGSGQFHPSSERFDSGVDDLEFPTKYIIWASSMNTHILPEFVVSFRSTSICREFRRSPRSDWMPFPTLIKVLSKFLPSDAIELINKHHRDFKKQKLPRHEMVHLVRNIAGDNLLAAILKSYRGKVNAFSNTRVGAARNNRTERSE